MLNWEYDEDRDVLYIAVGNPRPAIGADIGDGMIVRCDNKKRKRLALRFLDSANEHYEV